MSKFFKVIVTGLAAIAMLATQANAQQLNNMTYTFTQVGADVVITGRGGFITTGLTVSEPQPTNDPRFGVFSFLVRDDENESVFNIFSQGVNQTQTLVFDSFVNVSVNELLGSLGPGFATDFPSEDSPGSIFTEEITGDANGFLLRSGSFDFSTPVNYVSGSLLTSVMTFRNTALAEWGLEMGKNTTFSYFDADGGEIGTITLSVAAIPEPSALLLVGSVVGAGLVRRRRR